jgi:hypothetical protein
MRHDTESCLVMALLSWFAGSCGGQSSGGSPLDVSVCSAGWNVLLQSSQNVAIIDFAPRSPTGSGLTWSNGQLYFEYYDNVERGHPVIASLSTSGRGVTQIAAAASPYWWIEADQLTYIAGNYVLYGTLLDGSTQPIQLVDIGQGAADLNLSGFVLDTQAIYWISVQLATSDTVASWSLWQATRGTGQQLKLADMPLKSPASGIGSSLTLTEDSVLVYDQDYAVLTGTLYKVPKTGGAPAVLPTPVSGWPIGIGSDGTSIWGETSGNRPQLWRATANGTAPSQVWPDLPRSLYFTDAWPDGSGGWYLVGWEPDNSSPSAKTYTSVWLLDGKGQASRLACAPLPFVASVYAGATSSDSLYLLLNDGSHLNEESIVSITR